MKVTRTDLDKASFKVVKAVYQLEQIEKAYPGIEEETEDLMPVVPYVGPSSRFS